MISLAELSCTTKSRRDGSETVHITAGYVKHVIMTRFPFSECEKVPEKKRGLNREGSKANNIDNSNNENNNFLGFGDFQNWPMRFVQHPVEQVGRSTTASNW